jgi:serine/threonine protein kinase
LDPKSQQPSSPDGTLPTAFEKPRRERSSGAVGELRADAQIGKYRVVRHLGAGGMGAVYEAVHVEIGKAVALKLLTGELAQDPRAHARFLQEAANLSRLEHPHVVGVVDFGADAESPYLVMELLRGEDLADHICRHLKGLPVEKAVDILLAVCSGIIAAHEAGIIHRDIKPRNIFLAVNSLKEVVPKVLDFGIAKVDGEGSETSLTQKGAVVGTPQYIAPEQIRGAPADQRTDQYALGVVLYECLVGRNAFEGHTPYEIMKAVEAGRFFAPSKLRPDVPAELEQITLRAMSNDPSRRFASILEMGRALLPFASPRQRANWTSYFTGHQDRREATASTTAPIPSAIVPPNSTRMLQPPPPEVADSSWFVNSSTVHSTTYRTPRNRTARKVAMLLLGIGGVLAAVLATRNPRLHSPENGVPAAAVNAPPPEGAGAGPRPLEPPAQPAASKEVTITVTGSPPDATFNLDGWPKKLPIRLARGSQQYELSVWAPGFESQVQTIRAEADQEIQVHLKPLVAEPVHAPEVSINIASDPPGAEVWIDGESASLGTTPKAIAVPKSTEPRRITLKHEGFQTRSLVVVPDIDRAPNVVRLVRIPAVRRKAAPPREEPKRPYIMLPD